MAGLQLRHYKLKTGSTADFLHAWSTYAVPLREQYGFSVISAWTVAAEEEFVWIVSHDGDLEAVAAEYYNSPERKAFPVDPGSFVETVTLRMLTPLPASG